MSRQMLIAGFSARGESCLEGDTMIGRGRLRCSCARTYELRIFRVLVVSVLIGQDQIPTEMPKMPPALENHSAVKRLTFCRNHKAIVFPPGAPVCVTPAKFERLEFQSI